MSARYARVSRFWTLSPAQRRLFVQAVICLPLFGLALRLLGFQTVYRRVNRSVSPLRGPLLPDEMAETVDRATRHGFYRASCLPRSLLLYWLLRRAGWQAALLLGVRREQGRLIAHAWVEVDGRPLNEPVDVGERFAPMELA